MTIAIASLLIGGGPAVAIGVANQDPNPPSPSVDARGSLTTTQPSSDPSSKATTSPKPGASSSKAGVARPVAIQIPSIDVSSPLTVIGLQADGSLEVPQPGPDYDKAAWFGDSPAPGEIGPAVIEGHVDGPVNGPSVFYRLGELQPRDRLSVTRRDGTTIRFEVYAVRLFAKSRFPTLKVYGNTAEPELRLITCGGPFDPNRDESGYTDNVVVFARQV
ncbi:MAG: class F sortase [Actinomycetia bacterium]|nr:class F sortase [Actinomycetes bacterium]